MGKVTSLYGKTTGKIGSIVFSTSGGETIAREYNPHVSNPNTEAQVNQRARLKLMSQLSANLAPVIVMQKDGLISRRNKFVKRNFEAAYASQGVAQISYENVQLTEGNAALPQIISEVKVDPETGSNVLAVGLANAAAVNISRVIYCLFTKDSEGRLAYVGSFISSIPDNAANYSQYFGGYFDNVQLQQGTGDTMEVAADYVIYAYGMIDSNEQATAKYGNMQVSAADDIARLVANRTINFTDYNFTMTRGTTIGQGSSEITPVTPGQARVFVTALGNGGTVSGGGTFAIGSTVTVTATTASGYVFSRWIKNGTNQTISTSATYSFTLNEQTDLVAVFDADNGGGL